MSAVEPLRKPLRRIPRETKAAILAALGSGRTQTETAQQFGVHYNSVHNLWKLVKAEQAKAPIEWKHGIVPRAQATIERALDHTQDVIGAANVALKLMHGIGYLTTSNQLQVDGNVNLQVSWGAVQEPEPEPALDVDHKQVSDGQ